MGHLNSNTKQNAILAMVGDIMIEALLNNGMSAAYQKILRTREEIV